MFYQAFSFLFLIVLVVAGADFAQHRHQKDDQLFESGAAGKHSATPNALTEFTAVTYNIRWRTGAELQQIADWIKKKDRVAIIALQEVDRRKQRTGKTNNARALADRLGMYYAWAAPPSPAADKEEDTGVELLSLYPLSDIKRIVLPHKGPGGRARVALGATMRIGNANIRVYSVHSETRLPVSEKLDQFRAVLDDLARLPRTMAAVVMGDFNSWEPQTVEAVRELFSQEGFSTPFADEEPTFKRSAIVFDVQLKLDWIWLRGLTAKNSGIDRSITVSDHFPLSVRVTSPVADRRSGSPNEP